MTTTFPTCAEVAVPVAVSCVEEMYVVTSTAVPKFTVAPWAKCAPVMFNVNVPTGIAIGVTVTSCGTGLRSVTALEPICCCPLFLPR